MVHGGGGLEQLDLRQDLELATSFVEVDQTVVCCVAESCVDHHQIRQKRSEIRHGALYHRRARLSHRPQYYVYTALQTRDESR